MAIIISVENEHSRIKISGLSTTYNSVIERVDSVNGYDEQKKTTFTLSGTSGNTFYDYVVEPGVIYKYKITENSVLVYNQADALFIGSEGAYLYGLHNTKPSQLKFIYNTTVSGFSKVRKDSVIETIGAKYPFVVRASELGYKTFNFSGIVVFDIDSSLGFSGGQYSKLLSDSNTSVSAVNSDYINSYKDIYNPDFNQNFVLEKFFRRNVLDWLTDGSPKIFKSDTEGMFLGKLSSVSMEPVDGLNRLLYSVSFSFTETSECTYEKASTIVSLSKRSAESISNNF